MTVSITPSPSHHLEHRAFKETAHYNEDLSLLQAEWKALCTDILCPPRIPLFLLLSVIWGAGLMVMVGYAALTVPKLTLWLTYNPKELIQYSAQVPFALFFSAFLGGTVGFWSVALFMALGIFGFPVFANGGGLGYIEEPGFGFLLGLAISCFFTGRWYNQVLAQRDLLKQLIWIPLTAVCGVALLHLVGVLTLLIQTAVGYSTVTECLHWSKQLSLTALPYDLISTTVLFALVRLTRCTFWFFIY